MHLAAKSPKLIAFGGPVTEPLPEDLPLQRAYHWEKESPLRVFLTQPVQGEVRNWDWSQTMDEARRMAAYLLSRQWPPESRIAILAKNSAWWMMAELAIWMSGHVSVPVYASLSAPAVRALLEHCEPVAIFIGAVDDKGVLTDGIPQSVERITFPGSTDNSAVEWRHILQTHTPLAENPVREASSVATIIYTSGTTGTPKGAMHRFSSFVYFAVAAIRAFDNSRECRMLSYLPLAHIAERALVEAVAYTAAPHLYFVESIDTFMTDLQRARPTVFFSVPRLYLKFQQRVLEKLPDQKLDRLLSIPLVRFFVQRKILTQLGLNCTRVAASGGAALPLATLQWFRKIGLNLVEGYGMTETGITHTPPYGRSKPGYVGDSIPGVETRIAENGEVLVRSPMNMVGYFRNPEATRECFTDDGFFKTGDMGELDAEGWLRICGRVKEQFKTTKGKYVSPNRIELLLSASPEVESCCVIGDGMNQPFAIVALTPDLLESVARPEDRSPVEQQLRNLLAEVNAGLDAHERLQFLVVTDPPWTVGNGMLTPTMKLKRRALESVYGPMYESWVSQRADVVWHVTTERPARGQSGV